MPNSVCGAPFCQRSIPLILVVFNHCFHNPGLLKPSESVSSVWQPACPGRTDRKTIVVSDRCYETARYSCRPCDADRGGCVSGFGAARSPGATTGPPRAGVGT